MSTREPMWYCHECHAEMRPLMMPDPHCASCNGTFVEKIENPTDDPRDFRLAETAHWEDGALPGEMDGFLAGLRSILRPPNPVPRPTSPTSSTGGTAGSSTDSRRSSGSTDRARSPISQVHTTGRNGQFTIRIERSSTPGGRSRTVILGGNPNNDNNDVPTLSQFAPPRNEQGRPNITGPMVAQYLLALMGPGHGNDPFADMLGGMFGPNGPPQGGPGGGRWGDYVFNQEALDQIITQIMESNNTHQPVPAPEDVANKLPREVLEKGSPLLEKDCAVCKDQFELDPADEAEKVVVTLPCKHPFHEPCILPWLKTSGTCPVCRYQLVSQPESHGPGGPPTTGASRPSSPSSNPGTGTGSGGTALFQNMLNLFSSNHGGSSSSNSTDTTDTRTNNNPGNRARGSSSDEAGSNSTNNIPGGWADQID